MKPKAAAPGLILIPFLLLNLAMARHGQYDEEAREEERRAKLERKEQGPDRPNPITGIASGVKQAAVDSTTGLISETAESTAEKPPVIGTLEGARDATEGVVDNAVKGVVKVATFGYADVHEVKKEEPEKGSGEPTKFSINW